MSMTKSEIAARISTLRRELGENVKVNTPEPAVMTKSRIAERISQLKNEIKGNSAEDAPKEGFMHRLGQLGRGLATGIGRTSDTMSPVNPIYGFSPDDLEGIVAKQTGNPMSEELPRALGLGEHYEPEQGDNLGKSAKFFGEMLEPSTFLPFGGYGIVGNAFGNGAKAVGKAAAKELGMMGAQAAAIKGTGRFSEEDTIPGALEDILVGIGTGAGLSGARKGFLSAKDRIINPEKRRLSGIEKSVSDYLIDKVGVENVDGVLKNIREYESSIGYKPLTAEIAENDALAQLYRAQKGIAGTGIDEQQALGADAIKAALDKSKITKLSSQEASQAKSFFQEKYKDAIRAINESDLSPEDALKAKDYMKSKGRLVLDDLNNSIAPRDDFLSVKEYVQQTLKAQPQDISHTQEYVRGRTAALENDAGDQIRRLGSRADTTETGRTLQNTLIEVLKEKEQTRRTPTKPMYDSLNENFAALNPTNALEVLNNTVVKGDVAADYNAIKKMLKPANLSKADMVYKKSYDKALANLEATGAHPEHIENFKRSAKHPKSTEPTVAELSATRKAINTMLEKFERSGEKTRAMMVRKVKDALDQDLQSVPEQRAADALFRELSGPVSEITENKALRAVTKERHGKPIMSESRVPGVFINSSAGSIDDARALLRQIHDKPEAMQAVRDHLHEKAIASIADPKTGIVNLERIEAFKNKYPGARILYPDLYNVKLKDLSHATFAANKFADKTRAVQKTLERDAFCNLVGGDPKNIMPDTFNKNSSRNMKNLVSEVSQDASGKSMAGLKNETIDYFEKSISNRSKVGKHHVLSYAKLRTFMHEHEKALGDVLEPNQMGVVKEVEKIVGGQNSANTRGATLKSDTNANIRNALSLSNWSTGLIKASLTKLGISIPGMSEFVKNFADVRLDNKEAVLNRALRDTEYADFLMSTPLKSKQDAIKFSKEMKSFSNKRYLSPILMELSKKEQGE